MLTQDPFLGIEDRSAFRLDSANQAAAYIIRLRGELDLARCPDLESALREAEASGAERIVLDLEELEFIDMSAVGAIFRASRRSVTNGNRLQITRGKGRVARTFGLCELESVLPLIDPCLCPAIQDAG